MGRPRITKLQAVEDQLFAAGFLFLSNRNPISVHTLVSASKSVLFDLAKIGPVSVVTLYEEVIRKRLIAGREKEWRKYERRAANFFKHADQDPLDVLEDVDLDRLNSLELLLSLLTFFEMNKGLSASLWSVFVVVSCENDDCFDLSGLFDEHQSVRGWLSELSELNFLSRRRRCFELMNQFG